MPKPLIMSGKSITSLLVPTNVPLMMSGSGDKTMSIDTLAGKPPFELGTWVGRRQAFGLLVNKTAVADAECLKRLRDCKEYKSVGMTWEELCQRHLGVSRAQADRIISQ